MSDRRLKISERVSDPPEPETGRRIATGCAIAGIAVVITVLVAGIAIGTWTRFGRGEETETGSGSGDGTGAGTGSGAGTGAGAGAGAGAGDGVDHRAARSAATGFSTTVPSKKAGFDSA